MRSFPDLVALELPRARTLHPEGIHSYHEAYGVIFEELWEFFTEAMRKHPDPEQALAELVQVGAMAQRAAEDLGL